MGVLAQFNRAACHQLVTGGRVDEASVARAIEADLTSSARTNRSSLAVTPPASMQLPLEVGWVDVTVRSPE